MGRFENVCVLDKFSFEAALLLCFVTRYVLKDPQGAGFVRIRPAESL